MGGVGERVCRNMRIEAIGCFFYFCFVTVVAFLRNNTRGTYKIPGTLIEDFLTAAFVYPTVLYQIKDQVTTMEIHEAASGDKASAEAVPEDKASTKDADVASQKESAELAKETGSNDALAEDQIICDI